MDSNRFNALVESVRHIEGINHCELIYPRNSHIDIAAIREKYAVSQARLADMLGVCERTVREWESGRKQPKGPARLILCIAKRRPDVFLDSLWG